MHSSKSLPRSLRDLIRCPPKAGEGVHKWIFKLSCRLQQHRKPEDIYEILRFAIDGCGRAVSDRELWEAIHNSKKHSNLGHPKIPVASWPAKEPDLVGSIVQNEPFSLVDLWESSPVRLECGRRHDHDQHCENATFVVDYLFPGDPILCCGGVVDCNSQRKSNWGKRFHSLSHVVPNPMSHLTGKTASGRISARSLSNTGSRRFLVVEFDQGSLDQQACLMCHLALKAPLTMVVFSGNRSLHGWFYCQGTSNQRCRRFMEYAVSLGADSAMWTPCQMARMPFGVRSTGQLQSVLYFRPNVISDAG